MKDSPRIMKVKYELNRDKVLDEAIFLALCGLTQCREGMKITGVVRLELAKIGLETAIKGINKKLDEDIFHNSIKK